MFSYLCSCTDDYTLSRMQRWELTVGFSLLKYPFCLQWSLSEIFCKYRCSVKLLFFVNGVWGRRREQCSFFGAACWISSSTCSGRKYCNYIFKQRKIYAFLYLSLTTYSPTMRYLRPALNKRGWSTRSTVRGGPSFWPCAGPTHIRTCYRRSPLQSRSSRWPISSF